MSWLSWGLLLTVSINFLPRHLLFSLLVRERGFWEIIFSVVNSSLLEGVVCWLSGIP